MRPLIVTIVGTLAFAACMATESIGSVGGAALRAEGVSSLDYSPKPFHSTNRAIRVRFTTVERAPRGRVYAVWIHTGLGNPHCYNEVPYGGDSPARPPIRGGPGKTYTVTIRANGIDSDATFCKGQARLEVSTELIDYDLVYGPKRHNLRTLRFRIR